MRQPRTILWVSLGVLAGFLGAHGILASLIGELQVGETGGDQGAPPREGQFPSPMRATSGTSAATTASSRLGTFPPALSEVGEESEGVEIDWGRARINLPIHDLENLATSAFTSENQSPWAPEAEAFVLSPALNRILQLDEGQSDAVRNVLLESRQHDTAPRWATPTSLQATASGVAIEIAPAGEAVEASLRASLIGIMGEKRAAFFLQKIKPTLDWEYGGFGRLRRVVEVSVLPDDTLSIRESLRGTEGEHAPAFEVQARQYRVDRLPPSIAALVEIEE